MNTFFEYLICYFPIEIFFSLIISLHFTVKQIVDIDEKLTFDTQNFVSVDNTEFWISKF